MKQEQTHTDTSVRCRRLDATTGDQCIHRSPWQTGDCGQHAPKQAKRSRKSVRRPAPAARRRPTRTRFHDDIDAADMGYIN